MLRALKHDQRFATLTDFFPNFLPLRIRARHMAAQHAVLARFRINHKRDRIGRERAINPRNQQTERKRAD